MAGIAILELPQNQWHEVIVTLVQNAQGAENTFRVAALETLSYICEELKKGVLNETEVDGILSAVVSSLTDADEVKEIAMKALQSVIPFCEKNLKVEAERALLLGKIIENCKSEVEDIKLKAMKCLLEVTKYFYNYIGNDGLDVIGIVTIEEIKKKDNNDVGVLAVEVWSTICYEEISRLKKNSPTAPCMNYIPRASQILLPLLLEALTNTNDKADFDTDWDVSLASACCISLMAEILKDSIVPLVTTFVNKCFASGDWKLKKAGILAFVSIIKGPNKAIIDKYISSALSTFLELLQDKEPQIRESIAWAFSKFTESNCNVLVSQQVFIPVMTALITSLKDTANISKHICFAISEVATELKPSDKQTTSLLSPIFSQLLKALWDNALRGDAFDTSVNLAYSSFVAFSSVILHSAVDTLPALEEVFKMLVNSFNSTLNGTFPISTRTDDFQGYFCTALNSIFLKVGSKMDSNVIDTMVNLLIESFKRRGSVYDEGLQAFCGLISGLGKAFKPFTVKFEPYLAHSLKNINDTALCRVAIGCAGDLARALEEEICAYLKDLVPLLFEILRNPETEYGLKPIAISALGDLASSAGKGFEQYLGDFLELLKVASSLSLKLEDDVLLNFYYRMTLNILNTTVTSKALLSKLTQALSSL